MKKTGSTLVQRDRAPLEITDWPANQDLGYTFLMTPLNRGSFFKHMNYLFPSWSWLISKSRLLDRAYKLATSVRGFCSLITNKESSPLPRT